METDPDAMTARRARTLNAAGGRQGAVLYWMSRDQRAADNWALLHAQRTALERRSPLIVLFCLAPRFSDATLVHYDFMLRGLKAVEADLRRQNIPFILRAGKAAEILPAVVEELGAGMVVADQNPLRAARAAKSALALSLPVPLVEADAHNIVPVWRASPKLEFGAYTLRPKLNRLLPEFFTEFPALVRHPFSAHPIPEAVDWEKAAAAVRADAAPAPAVTCESGERAARAMLDEFIAERFDAYGRYMNDPTLDSRSHLSPYIHFGQISAQRIALEVKRCGESSSADAFLEELIIRRELADNFCFYNDRYDSFEGFPAWAQLSLNNHRGDERTHRYAVAQFEAAETHDPLWNAAQREMLATGTMHGYMRMYWAKKILEWTASPEEAMAIAVYLNDRYELDGRDPNGYAGIAWSIGGVHDRAWFERPVFGKVRYMNAAGCARKFDVTKYIGTYAAVQ